MSDVPKEYSLAGLLGGVGAPDLLSELPVVNDLLRLLANLARDCANQLESATWPDDHGGERIRPDAFMELASSLLLAWKCYRIATDELDRSRPLQDRLYFGMALQKTGAQGGFDAIQEVLSLSPEQREWVMANELHIGLDPSVIVSKVAQKLGFMDATTLAQTVRKALRLIGNLDEYAAKGDAVRIGGTEQRDGARTHSADFTSVLWDGQAYTFSKGNQAESVRVLWEAWENGTPTLSEKTIGEKIGSGNDTFRLLHVFRSRGKQHPAWGVMIVKTPRGTCQLAE